MPRPTLIECGYSDQFSPLSLPSPLLADLPGDPTSWGSYFSPPRTFTEFSSEIFFSHLVLGAARIDEIMAPPRQPSLLRFPFSSSPDSALHTGAGTRSPARVQHVRGKQSGYSYGLVTRFLVIPPYGGSYPLFRRPILFTICICPVKSRKDSSMKPPFNAFVFLDRVVVGVEGTCFF